MKLTLFLLATCLCAAGRYPVTGIILEVDAPHRTFTASCAAIPGYMEAMVMSYTVREEKSLDGLQPGTPVEFTLVVEKGRSWAEGVKVRRYENMEQEALRARRLQLLEDHQDTMQIGQLVPDFTLTDQTGQRVSLSQFRGKAVAVTFIYTSCPLPDYCFRLSNNFAILNRRLPHDLILLSITFDPVHDNSRVLAKYAATWKADPQTWHFLTGTLPEIKDVCRRFGLNFWQDEGLLTHSLHTVVIDRRGALAANFEGNTITAAEIGDFIVARALVPPVPARVPGKQ
jgi:protein SCO1/2